jgi:hypothetical protein
MDAPGRQEVVDGSQEPAPQRLSAGLQAYIEPLHGRRQTGLLKNPFKGTRVLPQPAHQAFVVGDSRWR